MSLQIVKKENKVQGTRVDRAKELDKLAKGSILQLVFAIKEIRDNDYYFELGYDSMRDYCLKSLNYSFTNATYYMSIADKMGKYISITDDFYAEKSSVIISDFNSLSLSKLYLISRLPGNSIENLFDTGEVKLSNKTLSLEVIKETSREDLAKMITRELNKQEENPKQKKQKQDKTQLQVRNDIVKFYSKFVEASSKFNWDDATRLQLGRALEPVHQIIQNNILNK